MRNWEVKLGFIPSFGNHEGGSQQTGQPASLVWPLLPGGAPAKWEGRDPRSSSWEAPPPAPSGEAGKVCSLGRHLTHESLELTQKRGSCCSVAKLCPIL